ncbi:hypothetical protein C4577_02070 [Candidatus Parcubacteria bacterium]|nr:MAG: hypothetical protein C4577_02070 [Candidatus Parcubacteria bacterium]
MTSEEILFECEERMEKVVQMFSDELRGLRIPPKSGEIKIDLDMVRRYIHYLDTNNNLGRS